MGMSPCANPIGDASVSKSCMHVVAHSFTLQMIDLRSGITNLAILG